MFLLPALINILAFFVLSLTAISSLGRPAYQEFLGVTWDGKTVVLLTLTYFVSAIWNGIVLIFCLFAFHERNWPLGFLFGFFLPAIYVANGFWQEAIIPSVVWVVSIAIFLLLKRWFFPESGRG